MDHLETDGAIIERKLMAFLTHAEKPVLIKDLASQTKFSTQDIMSYLDVMIRHGKPIAIIETPDGKAADLSIGSQGSSFRKPS